MPLTTLRDGAGFVPRSEPLLPRRPVLPAARSLLGSLLNNLRPAASYMHADRLSHAPCRAPPSKHPAPVAHMTMRRASASGLQANTEAERVTAASGQLVDELYRGLALRLTRMALLLVGDQPSAEDVVQEAFLGLFRGLGRLNDPSRAWPTCGYRY